MVWISSARTHRSAYLCALSILTLVIFFTALCVGSSPLSFRDALFALFGADTQQAHAALVVWELRLPRAALALCVGAMLAISGAAMQGLFRNPLADPALIGVTAGASLGASLTIFFAGALAGAGALSQVSRLGLTGISACIGGALAVLLVYRIATRAQKTSVTTMLLAGMAITALAGGISNLLEYFSDSSTLRQLSMWRMGSLESSSYARLFIAAVLLLLSLSVLQWLAPALNAFLLGESEARHLGLHVERTKRCLILIVGVATGSSVALAGSIVFIGLIVPHMLRMVVGPDHRILLPACALGGASLLCAADSLSRIVIAPSELPVGLIIALLGAPFFVFMLRQYRSYDFQ